MANKDIPNGAVPCDQHGGYHIGSMNLYHIASSYATALAVGDFVKMSGTAEATSGVPGIERAAATDTDIVGVIVGFKPRAGNLDNTYSPASTEDYAFVADHPDQLFSIQEDSTGGSIAVTAVGNNADISVAAVDTTTGLSGMELDSSDVKTATAQLRILRLDPAVDNELGTNARWIVKINEHLFARTAGV